MTGESPGRNFSVTRTVPTPLRVRTEDGIRLHGLFWPSAVPRSGCAVVVGHGLTHHVGTPTMRRIAERLARRCAVVALDFRGHGRSAGSSTMGDEEVLDIAAGVRLARERGFETVATLGFSMGGSVVLRHAGLYPDSGLAAVVAVSSPSRWWIRDTTAMRRVHWLAETPQGRVLARCLGLRLGHQWTHVPVSPLEVMPHIAPTPLLLVHGSGDHYFGPEHALALHRAANRFGELWLEPGMRHGESAMTPELLDRIVNWLLATTGRPQPNSAVERQR